MIRLPASGSRAARCTDLLTLSLVGAMALLPLATVSIPPIHDYPGHLARVFILDDLLRGGFFSGFYSLNPAFVPNLAFDAVTLGLMQILDPFQAGMAALLFIQALTLSGLAALSHAIHGRVQLPVLLGAVFINNWILAFGFLSYLTGIGLLLWGVAAFLRSAARPVWQQALVIGAFSLALYTFHLVASGLYGVILGCLLLQEAIRGGRSSADRAAAFALRLAPLLLPALLYLWLQTSASGPAIDWGHYLRDWAGSIFQIGRKAKIVWASILSGNPAADALSAAALGLLAGFVLLRGSIVIDRRFWLPAAALVALTVIAPVYFGNGHYIDTRLPVPAVYLAIAAAQVRLARRDGGIVRGAIGGLVALRAAIFLAAWAGSQRYYEEYVRAFDALAPHATLYMASPETDYFPGYDGEGLYRRWWAPSAHTVTLAAIERRIFVPQVWALPRQHSILRKPGYQGAFGQAFRPQRVTTGEKMAALVAAIRKAHREGLHPPGPVYLMAVRPGALSGALADLPVVAEGRDFAIHELGITRLAGGGPR